MFLTSAGIPSTSPRSNGMNRSDPGRVRSACSIDDSSCSFICRAIAIASYPSQTSRRTMPSPKPRLPPVTMTLRRMPGHLACRGDLERRDDADSRRNLVRRQRVATGLEDLVRGAGRLGSALEHHVRGDEGAGDWTVFR